MDASAANYRTLNRFLRHNSSTSSELIRRVGDLDALAVMAPRLVEPLTLWRGFSSMAYVQHLKEAHVTMLVVFFWGGKMSVFFYVWKEFAGGKGWEGLNRCEDGEF